MKHFLRLGLMAIASLSGSMSVHAGEALPPITVFAAASLKESLDAVAAAWTSASGQKVHVSYAGTSVLARQIEQGAEADLMISADSQWMDHLERLSLIEPATRTDLLGNRLVLIAPASSKLAAFALDCLRCWNEALGARRLALAEITGVPAGRYAHEALSKLSLWPALSTRTAQADNVRAAMTFVALDEAPLGIVYATDARAEPSVRVLARFPAALHAPIVYPVAQLRRGAPRRSDGFFSFLRGAQAHRLFEQAGFDVLMPVSADVQR